MTGERKGFVLWEMQVKYVAQRLPGKGCCWGEVTIHLRLSQIRKKTFLSKACGPGCTDMHGA